MNVRFPALLLILPALAVAQVSELIHQQKTLLESPVKLVEGKNLIPTAAVIAATVSLVALDPVDEPAFQGTKTFRGFNNVFSGRATEIGTIAAPVALLAMGFARRDEKMQRTSFAAGEAMGDAEVLAFALKNIVRRESPGATSNGSFPSGHTAIAFAGATVFARRYRKHRWVPFVAYGLAGAIGFSRVTSSAHYLSDVFAAAAMGYAVGRFIDANEGLPANIDLQRDF